MKHHRPRHSTREAVLSLRDLLVRIALILMVLLAIGLIMLSRSDSRLTDTIRTKVMDGVVPVLGVISRPVEAYQTLSAAVTDYFAVYEENKELRRENEQLRRLQSVAVAMEVENRRLREMVKYIPEPEMAFITARVVGDLQGVFTKSVFVNAGQKDGVYKGQVVKNKDGLVGRIMEAGHHSAHILLITDIRSKIPVMTDKSDERASVSGTNDGMLTIQHVANDTKIEPGEMVVTSGDGEFFPSGIPVGTVTEVSEESINVSPLADWRRLEYVNVIEYARP